MARMMDEIGKPEWFRKLVSTDHVAMGIGDLSRATGVSPTQLRYWTDKNYIEVDEHAEGKHKYAYETIYKVRAIKSFLDDGFTLSAAVSRMAEHRAIVHALKHVVTDRIEDVEVDGNEHLFDFGPFDPDPTCHLLARVNESGTTFELQKKAD
ncbi:MerR family transcriptional regulator [Furfurilactobacillus siliginis]|uniref:MerR family transcriptional regulator n=1 Tax=Furfurilactobacillus siliginis TaxID=348151 RepID=A0A0R2L3F1_9LACO|nr:MerR family transcriptional regulator [Furfurilactobacillus siliginis]KRN96328.1 hypothetical protein IV55_GL001289 [Furfurilactobacillus siliginis]GEK29620.1 MerR family transcriptional regulator [Furfurilactobacillus siliginis]